MNNIFIVVAFIVFYWIIGLLWIFFGKLRHQKVIYLNQIIVAILAAWIWPLAAILLFYQNLLEWDKAARNTVIWKKKVHKDGN